MNNDVLILQYGTRFLRVTKKLSNVPDPNTTNDTNRSIYNENKDDDDEQDEEALVRSPQTTGNSLFIYYDIIHSPFYQVPVLYLTLNQPPSQQSGPERPEFIPSLDKLYTLLTPASVEPQLRTGGVLGALSMTDHPTTGLPAYFVHPCRTAEAMVAVIGDRKRDVKPAECLLLWLGLVGRGVGLDVPVALAKVMTDAKSLGERNVVRLSHA